MRTRLDEIVDEELAAFPELRGQPCGGRIAERAFRHGVEQAVFGGWAFGGIEGVRPGPCYRPAPAENIPDRRKVERRKP